MNPKQAYYNKIFESSCSDNDCLDLDNIGGLHRISDHALSLFWASYMESAFPAEIVSGKASAELLPEQTAALQLSQTLFIKRIQNYSGELTIGDPDNCAIAFLAFVEFCIFHWAEPCTQFSSRNKPGYPNPFYLNLHADRLFVRWIESVEFLEMRNSLDEY